MVFVGFWHVPREFELKRKQGMGKNGNNRNIVKQNHRFSVYDSNIWIGVNPRVVVAPFARRHLWCIFAAVSVGSHCVVARFARRHLWGICAAVSVGSQCVVARYKKGVPDEAKYTYRVHVHAPRAQHTYTHVSMWCLA